MSNFIEKCIQGSVLLDDIDDFIDEWHEGENDESLHKFLGMTESEYSLWVADPEILPFIVIAHQQNRDVSELIDELDTLPMVARSSNPKKAQRLAKWLKHEGLWK